MANVTLPHNLGSRSSNCSTGKSLCPLLAQASLAVLEGFGEVIGFDDIGAVEVGDGSG
jgi:hypothetical protein